ncbi:hypothetical protein KSS87_014429 [Heliosperma pusillum]|nr:hypothetical protein KSS87_014429 [Heliosperma pusillum]
MLIEDKKERKEKRKSEGLSEGAGSNKKQNYNQFKYYTSAGSGYRGGRAGHAERIAEMLIEDKKERKEKRKSEGLSEGAGSNKKQNYNQFKSYTSAGSGYRGGVSQGFVGREPYRMQCYNCGKFGHKANDCRSSAKSTIIGGGFGNGNQGEYRTPAPSFGSNRFSGNEKDFKRSDFNLLLLEKIAKKNIDIIIVGDGDGICYEANIGRPGTAAVVVLRLVGQAQGVEGSWS